MEAKEAKDEKKEVTISEAPSARSKCQICKEPIAKGDMRVGMPSRHNGLSVVKWIKPACAVSNSIFFDYAPTGRAKCCTSGRTIEKGELRMTMDLFNCEGKYASRNIFFPPAASAIVLELLALEACNGHSVESLTESIADDEARSWARDALSGRDVSALSVPVAAPAAKPTKAKRNTGDDGSEKPAKKPKKQKKQASPGSDEDEGEAVD